MDDRYIRQLNTLFEKYDEIEGKAIKKEPVDDDMIADALTQSCLVLRSLVEEKSVSSQDFEAMQRYTKLLHSDGFREFLDTERKLLKAAGASQIVVDVLLNDVKSLVKDNPMPVSEVLGHVMRLREQVCGSVDAVLQNKKRMSIVKRVARVVGGGIIILANAAPPVAVAITPLGTALSVVLGQQIMGEQAKQALDFLQSKAPWNNQGGPGGGMQGA